MPAPPANKIQSLIVQLMPGRLMLHHDPEGVLKSQDESQDVFALDP